MQVKLVAIDKVAASLREFGWRQPIVVETEMTVIVGHARLLAAKLATGWNLPPFINPDIQAQTVGVSRFLPRFALVWSRR